MDATPAPAAPDAAKKKSFMELVLTMTPVALTVLGTILAGISSSEMTLAQYFRTLAAQNQSKAADQWQFFQVKRIRGTSLETTLDLMPVPAPPGPLDPDLLLAQAERLSAQVRHANLVGQQARTALSQAEQVANLPEARRGPLLIQLASLVPAAAEGQDAVGNGVDQLRAELGKAETRAALTLVQQGQLPKVETRPLSDPAIKAAMDAISRHAAQDELTPLLLPFSIETVEQAIHAVELNYRDVEDSTRHVAAALRRLERLIQRQLLQVQAFHKAVLTVENALGQAAATSQPAAALPGELQTLKQADRDLLLAATELNQGLQAAQHFYTGLRYRAEAEYNAQAALLYEVQVRKNSFVSERHRARSKLFFYAMLCAQAGVAVSSMSLAGRQPRLLWALAVVQGLLAFGFGGYVYLAI